MTQDICAVGARIQSHKDEKENTHTKKLDDSIASLLALSSHIAMQQPQVPKYTCGHSVMVVARWHWEGWAHSCWA